MALSDAYMGGIPDGTIYWLSLDGDVRMLLPAEGTWRDAAYPGNPQSLQPADSRIGVEMQNAAELYAEKELDLYIVTSKGEKFYAARPTFDIEVMAHALSMQCRYTGHVSKFYSVAEHCILVSMMCDELPECYAGSTPLEASFEGLMHDAHEAFISDLAAPWKVLVPDYRMLEDRFEQACRKQYNLPPGKVSTGVKRADWYALFLEARQLLPAGVTDDWLVPFDGFRDDLAKVDPDDYGPRCFTPKEARRLFLTRFGNLNKEREAARADA